MGAEKNVAKQMVNRHDSLAEPAVADRYTKPRCIVMKRILQRTRSVRYSDILYVLTHSKTLIKSYERRDAVAPCDAALLKTPANRRNV